MSRIRELWRSYWLRPAPLVNLAVCRIVVVGYHLHYMLFFRGSPAEQYLGLSKVPAALYDPLPVLHLLVWPIDWHYRPSYDVLVSVHWLTAVAGVLAVIGLLTNVSLLLFAVGSIFLQAFKYSFGDFHHPEAIMMIMLGSLALSPAGGALSADGMLRSYFRADRLRDGLEGESIFARWPLLLAGWLLALIYFSAFWSKLTTGGYDWLNGYTMQYYLGRDGIHYDLPLAVYLAEHHLLAKWMSWFTILFEGTFFLVLFFPRLAWIYVPAGIALHLGIYIIMTAPFFQFIAIYSAFVNWSVLVNWLYARREWEVGTHVGLEGVRGG